MKQNKKEKARILWKKFVSYFAVYAFLPLLCGMGTALILLINRVGAEDAERMLATLGEKTVFSTLGGELLEKEVPVGFYFFSNEIFLPLGKNATVLLGSNRYFQSQKPQVAPSLPPSVPAIKVPEIVYDSLPTGAIPIVSVDLSSASKFINTTKYTIDLEKARNDPFPSPVTSENGDPLVLVLHAHGTESYFEDRTNLSDFAPEGVESYFIEGETVFRTTDPTKSVVQVGKVFSETLTALGIPTLHCTVMHDKDDYNDAYVNSAETVKQYLKKYPSIQYVIDLHRDSVVRGEAWVKTKTEIEGISSAQVMLVVGTNQNGRHPNWEKNLVVATAFKDTMDQLYPSLSRSMYLRTARFNQEYLPGCMLLEVGSAANSLEEAETAARFAAQSFAQMLQNRQ